MKKLLFATLFCLVTSYTAQAQTKEETIAWLQEKFDKYLGFNDASSKVEQIKVESCNISVTYLANDKNSTRNFLQVSTNNVDFGERLVTEGDGIVISGFDINAKKYFFGNFPLLLKEGELDLRARVKKAVDHLATFCPKKKETF